MKGVPLFALTATATKETKEKIIKALEMEEAIILNQNPNRKNNSLLTKREGRTGKYWPEVVAVRTERSEVGTARTEGQYSPVQPEQARLVSGLLYGTVSDSKMQWHSVSDSKMQLQKRFVTESDKSSC